VRSEEWHSDSAVEKNRSWWSFHRRQKFSPIAAPEKEEQEGGR